MTRAALDRTATVARWITAAVLLFMTLHFLPHAEGALPKTVAYAELAASLLFFVPRIWRVAVPILLAVLLVAIIAHANISLIFPALVIVLVLAIDRTP